MISVIDRYLVRELLKVVFAILIVLSLVMSSLGFVKLLEKVALGDMNLEVVLPLIGLQILRYLARTIPAAFFLAILVVLGRMYRDSEMTVLAACGVGPGQIYRAFGYTLIPLLAFTAWVSLGLQPWASGEIGRIMQEQKQDAAELAGLQPGRFNEYSSGELVFYVEHIDRDKSEFENIFIQNRKHGELGVITAASGHHRYEPESGDHYLTLENGRRYAGKPGRADYVVAEFGSYTLRIAESAVHKQNKLSAKPSEELYASSDLADRAELWGRISFPISLITLTLIAIPLSRSMPRQGLYGRLFLAFLVYFIFFNLQAVSINWMEKGITPEWLGVWWVQAVLLLLAGLAMSLDSRWLRHLRRRQRRVSVQTG